MVNDYLDITESAIAVIEECANEHNKFYMLAADYDENNNALILHQIIKYVNEKNIKSYDLGIPSFKKNLFRYVMITNNEGGYHSGRMKVSNYGQKITKVNDYISLSIANEKKGIINVIGSIDRIDMGKNELELYKNLLWRNKELIQYASKLDALSTDVDMLLIKDENRRIAGYEVIRDKITGYAKIYKDGKFLYSEDNKENKI